MKKEDNFKGMIITLKKRMSYWGNNPPDDYQFTMFGYYDSMDICGIDSWYQLRPRGVYENGGVVNIDDEFHDKYTLKMYFPNRKLCSRLNQKGFNYREWEEISQGNTGGNKKDISSILTNNPFVSVAVIQMHQNNKENGKDPIGLIAGKISKFEKKRGKSLSEIHCAVFPTIGYADFVVLFLSDNPEKALEVIDFLRKEKTETGILLSSSYVITGFAKEGLAIIKDLQLDSIELSVRVNLREGVSANAFRHYFDSQIRETKKEYEEKKANCKTEVYQMFGNSDCLVLSDMPFDFFIPLYFDNKLLNPGHELFQKYICNIRSSLRTKAGLTDVKSVEIRKAEENKSYKKYRSVLQHIVKQMRGFVEEYHKQIRIVCGLEGVMKTFLNLCQTDHCSSAAEMIGQAFEVLDHNIERCIREIKMLSEKEKEYLKVENLMEAVQFFREKVGDYLSDLQRSDRFFIEGQSLSHASVGSATKLLLFYNEYINNIAQELVNTEKDTESNGEGKKKRYVFVVVSGGCDETKAFDLFAHLDPAVPEKESLIILSIPEMSLYDVKGTLFRLLHECLHFCGERFRKKRTEALMEALSIYVSDNMSDYLKTILNNDIWDEKIISGLENKLNKKEIERLTSKIKQIVEEEVRVFANAIHIRLASMLNQAMDEEAENRDHYVRYLEPNLIALGMGEIFAPVISKKDSLLPFAYQNDVNVRKNVAEKVVGYLKEYGVIYSNANTLLESYKYAQKMCIEGKYRDKDYRPLQIYFEKMIDNLVWDPKYQIDVDETVYWKNIVENMINVCRECYADCMAATILGISKEDFLLSFVYETWNIQLSFPETSLEILRLGLELKVLFGVEKCLGYKDRDKMEKRMDYWREKGFEFARGSVTAEGLIERVNKFIEKYQSIYVLNFMKPIESYIEECMQEMKAKSFRDQEYGKYSDMKNMREMDLLLGHIQKFW